MPRLYKLLLNNGITKDLPFKMKSKIRIANVSCLLIGLICFAYTISGILLTRYVAAGLTFMQFIFVVITLLLIHSHKYKAAFHFINIAGLLFLLGFTMVFGEINQTHVFFLFMPMAAVIFFDSMRVIFTYFIVAVIMIVLSMVGFKVLTPYYPYMFTSVVFGVLNWVFTAILLFQGMKLFKVENIAFATEINEQRLILEEKNKEIVSSIHYAKRIQKALLASDAMLKKNLPEYFVLYKPKDIVSGDFYWAGSAESRFLIAACDCTGHGVPGAFMSMLGVSFLNEIVLESKIIHPDLVFNHLRDDIIRTLNPEDIPEEGKDGMDAVICSFDFKAQKLEFACANNPLWIIRDKQLLEFSPDKFPVGMHEGDLKPFMRHEFNFQKNDMIFLFSDGYPDQFGGEKGKKFKYKNFQELLVLNSTRSMEEQRYLLDDAFEAWKGKLEQVDDVLVIGIRV